MAGLAVIAAAAVGLVLALTGGGGRGHASTTAPQTGLTWEQRFRASHLGAKQATVLRLWPKIPYQHYPDNLKDDCYEWQGDNLYNLCFKDGVLRSKTIF